jgi:hypothetical protein
VTELQRKHLVETDRHIAECEAYIAKQRELIERAIQQGRWLRSGADPRVPTATGARGWVSGLRMTVCGKSIQSTLSHPFTTAAHRLKCWGVTELSNVAVPASR